MFDMKKVLFFIFAFLIFFVPLVLWPYTSEVFEFNKIVLTYALTALIVGAWTIRSINERKFIFRRTILDIPLLVFIASQIISTILSIDPQTSFFGYYSRFNGGLLSTLCYSLLYWAFVSNFELKETLKLIKVWLAIGAIISLIGFGEHFKFFAVCVPIQYSQVYGVNADPAVVKQYNSSSASNQFNYLFRTSCWVQDVQSRVFATIGQPNWLAAWIVALLPLTWLGIIESKFEIKNRKLWLFFGLSTLFTWTLIFTKSRSGLLGFAVAVAIFGTLTAWKEIKNVKKLITPVSIIGISFLIIGLISGTQFTPSISQLIHHQSISVPTPTDGPALETGGTESGAIRAIVWKGAMQVWLHYPIFGTGVETFAYSYPMFRPAEHNLVSEWDFIYNKAHNEYLNFAANTGTFGLLSYLVFVGFSIYIFFKTKNYALLAGFVSLLVSNFFGFSVVPTQIELFLFPAIAVALTINNEQSTINKHSKASFLQKILFTLVLIAISYFLIIVYQYWQADVLYNHGKAENSVSKPDLAVKYLNNAINLEPSQATYHSEIANSYTSLALAAYQQKNATEAGQLVNFAVNESQKAIALSPANPNYKRAEFGVFINLSSISPNFLILAKNTLIDAVKTSPTDAKLYYNLGLVYARTGDIKNALATLQKTIQLKANYRDARLAYAILLINEKQNTEAKAQLEYILNNIGPNDPLTKQTLESIR